MLAFGMNGPLPDRLRAHRTPIPGLVVAVYGTDGSGKGTLIAGLHGRLREAFSGVLHVHLFELQNPEDPAEPYPEPHGASPRSPATSVVKVFWYLARAWIGRSPRLRRARQRGNLVLLDRDVPDARLDPVRYRIAAPRPVLDLLEQWAPRPDVGLLLDAPEEVIAARTDEVTVERLAMLRQTYRAFAARSPWVRTLDASRPANEVLEAAVAVVLDAVRRTSCATAVPATPLAPANRSDAS